MNYKRMSELWKEFEIKVLPPTAGPVQRREMKRAFYAGAQSLLTAILAMLDPGDEPTLDDLARMEALNSEILAFFRAVERGEE